MQVESLKKLTFVEFSYPSDRFAEGEESITKEVATRNVEDVAIPRLTRGVVNKFRFYDVISSVVLDGNKKITLSSGEINRSSTYWLGGRVFGSAVVPSDVPQSDILGSMLHMIKGQPGRPRPTQFIESPIGCISAFQEGDVLLEAA